MFLGNDRLSSTFSELWEKENSSARTSAVVIFDYQTYEKASGSGFASKQEKLQFNKDRTQAQFNKFLTNYEELTSVKEMVRSNNLPLRARLHGDGIIPAATIDVTLKTLNEISDMKSTLENFHVHAILPNQQVVLQKPTDIDENAETPEEISAGITHGLSYLQAEQLWALAGKGRGVQVAVIDSGVDATHPLLQEKIKGFVILTPSGRVIALSPENSFDSGQHGTHVTGIVAGGETPTGVKIGIAPEVSIHALQMVSGERNTFVSSIFDGLAYCLDIGIDIINISMGMPKYEEKLGKAFDYLLEHETAAVISIGNSGTGTSLCPGNKEAAFSVGAIDTSMLLQQPDLSPQFTTYSGGCTIELPGNPIQRIVKPDVLAPGEDILSTVPVVAEKPSYRRMSGTSMAAPYVSGVLAILYSHCQHTLGRDIKMSDLLDIIRTSSHHPYFPNRPDSRWGYGRIDPIAAFNAL